MQLRVFETARGSVFDNISTHHSLHGQAGPHMGRKHLAGTLAASIALASCATAPSYRPVVDTQGVDLNRYEQDLSDCKSYAAQVDPARRATGGAIVGALFGAALGGAIGGRDFAGTGARIGAVEGVGVGAASGVVDQHTIVRNCLTGRGYRVLL